MAAQAPASERVLTFLREAGLYTGPVNKGWNQEGVSQAIERWQRQQGIAATGVWDMPSQVKLSTTIRGLQGQGNRGGLNEKAYNEAVSRYGPGMMALINHAELGPIIVEAAKSGRDLQWLTGQVQQTEYWQRTTQAQREWNLLKITDPGEANRRIDQTLGALRDYADRLGIPLNRNQLRVIAEDSVKFGWISADGQPDPMLADILFDTVKIAPGNEKGDTLAVVDQLKAAAAQQFINLTPQSANQLAQRVLTGEMSMEGAQAIFTNQAKSRHANNAGLAEALDNGVTMADYFQPIREDIANTLEISPDAVDFMKGPFAQAIDFTDSDGKVRAMTRTEAQRLARQQPQWKGTRDAQSQVGKLVSFLGQSFGRI